MTISHKAALAAILASVSALPASAATLAFSYQFQATGNTLSGTADGTLAADGNRFAIASLDSLAVNGAPVNHDYVVTGFDYTNGEQAFLSLDGSYLNLILSRLPPTGGYVLDVVFQVGTPYAAQAGTLYPAFAPGVMAALVDLGGTNQGEPYVRANYSAALVDGVPEPATWALMILGFGAIGATMRRRSVAVRFA